MDKQDQKLVEKIRNLMALAKNQKGKPEGERAAEFAAALMAKHNLHEAQIEIEDREGFAELSYDLGYKTMWRRSLFAQVCRFCDAKALYTQGSKNISFYGKPSSLEIVVYIYKLAEREINTKATAYFNDLKKQGLDRSNATKLRYDFCNNAVKGFSEKLTSLKLNATTTAVQEEQEVSYEAAKGTAVMVVNGQLQKVSDFAKAQIARAGKRIGSGSGVRASHNAAGYETGKSISVNPGLGSKPSTGGPRGLLK